MTWPPASTVATAVFEEVQLAVVVTSCVDPDDSCSDARQSCPADVAVQVTAMAVGVPSDDGPVGVSEPHAVAAIVRRTSQTRGSLDTLCRRGATITPGIYKIRRQRS